MATPSAPLTEASAPFALGRWPLNYLTAHGPRADPVAALTWGLIALSLLVVMIISAAVLIGVLVRKENTPEVLPSMKLVSNPEGGMAWIYAGLPLTVLALVVFLVWTMRVMGQVDSPASKPRLTMEVTGRQWWWQVRYLDATGAARFATANEIHIPTRQPVLVKLLSEDVIHSFWVPALTGKTDTIPGRSNISWLQASHAGVYRGQCTEYCGVQHAHMGFYVIAQEPAAFDAWLEDQGRAAPAPATVDAVAGQRVFVDHCGRCHTVRGTPAAGQRGPDLTHLMSRRTLAAGMFDNSVNNLSGWISNPQTLKPGTRMPTTYLSGPQLHEVVSYLETLK